MDDYPIIHPFETLGRNLPDQQQKQHCTQSSDDEPDRKTFHPALPVMPSPYCSARS